MLNRFCGMLGSQQRDAVVNRVRLIHNRETPLSIKPSKTAKSASEFNSDALLYFKTPVLPRCAVYLRFRRVFSDGG